MADTKERAQASISTPDLSIRQKLGNTALREVFTQERIAACEKEISHVRDIFVDKALERLTEMNHAFLSGKWDKTTQDTLISHAFSLKGQSESLGYKLLALTANSLRNYCENTREIQEEDRIVIAKHLAIIQVVLDGNIKGDGGELGSTLFSHLGLLIKKFRPTP